jgi:hypothetical protein
MISCMISYVHTFQVLDTPPSRLIPVGQAALAQNPVTGYQVDLLPGGHAQPAVTRQGLDQLSVAAQLTWLGGVHDAAVPALTQIVSLVVLSVNSALPKQNA